MGLSSDLISQLVKATNDDKKESVETTVYGTIVYDDKLYVKLDGSDLLTPISTTTNISDGERVTVMIKDHTAIVTGNVSSPSVSTSDIQGIGDQITEFEILIADKVSTEQLEAEIARIDTLVADNVTIRGELDATKGTIDDLTADNVTINDKLTATEAEIKKLDAEKVTADFVDANYAKITDLDVTNANVHNLNASFADIENLIFDSATGTTISTQFANSVISQVGEAQIKSAMIESVSASKILAGDIHTNQVRVLSEDGSLIIADETIQISDGSRVRVQIGKDASSDYSINIWDAAGNLMFSEGGITDSAIKDAIIRDDMVSDTANISAAKLDISSLFTVINDSTETINSTRIFLDDEAQTLDVVFKTMSSELEDVDNSVRSQGTQLSIIQGQINGKVWMQDIDDATGEMSTKFSSLEQDLDGFKTTVSDTYATKTSVEDATEFALRSYIVDLTANTYNQNTFYPVVSEVGIPNQGGYRAHNVIVHLNSYSNPTWSTHDMGFTCDLQVKMKPFGWGTVAQAMGWIEDNSYLHCDMMPAYIQQMTNSSRAVFYFRGGGRYLVFIDYDTTLSVKTSSYTLQDQTVAPIVLPTTPTNWDYLADSWVDRNRITIAETKIEQNTEAISLRATKEEVEKIEIGGRNIALSGGDSVTVNGITLEVSGYDYHIHGTNTNTSANYGLSFWTARSDILEPGAEYTISTTVPLPTGLYLGINTRNANGTDSMAGTPSSYLYGNGEKKSQTFICIADSDGYLHGFFGVQKSCGTVDVTFRIKLEKGNKPTDWTPAPEDLATSDDLDAVRDTVSTNIQAISDLSVSTEGIDAEVKRVETHLNESLETLGSDLSTLTQQVSTKVSPEDVQITVQQEIANGTSKVVTNTGFTFDDTGMTVAKSDSEMKTQITENGMTVYQNDNPTLTANNQGVEAKNLHASTYLIVGENSRFEDYIVRTNLAQNGDTTYTTGTDAYYGFWGIASETYTSGIILEAGRDYELTFDWVVDWGSAIDTTQVMCTVGCGSTAGVYSWDITGVTIFDTSDGKTSGHMVHTFKPTEEDISHGQYFAMRPIRTGAEDSLDGSTWTISNVCINSLKHRTGCFWIGGI